MPWYLNNKFLWLICTLTPPIGYLLVLCNRKRWSHKERIGYLLYATILTSLWVLKFISKEVQLTAIILTGIVLAMRSGKR
ncbi:hypothetical protein ACKTOS_28970 [Paenibacillus sp. KR2-11]